jgi:hypothetical protein
VGDQCHAQVDLLLGKSPGTHCIGGWVPGPVWTVAENCAPTGIRSPDRPARSELSRQTVTEDVLFESEDTFGDDPNVSGYVQQVNV